MAVSSVSQTIAGQRWPLLRAARFPFTAWILLMGLTAAVIAWRAPLKVRA
jgi:hypothetical protein